MALSGGLNALAKWLTSSIISGNGKEDNPAMTAERALSYAPVWSCVSKVTGAFMVMDLELLRSKALASEVQDLHPAHRLAYQKANAFQVACQFKRMLVGHALLWGNGRAYIVTHNGRLVSEGGIPIELLPMLPDRTDTAIIKGQKVHGTVVAEDDPLAQLVDLGDAKEKVFYFSDDEVIHVPGVGYDGVKGLSLITLAARTWSTGIGDEVQTQKQQKKGYAGGAILEAPPEAFRNAKDAEEFLEKFREQHEGAENAGKIGLLRAGIKLNVMQMSNQDAQFIERRRLNREDVALQFCLEGILGDSSNASYNSLYEKNLAYRVNCLSPWTVAIEQEFNSKLLNESERRRGYRFKFDDRTLLRMDANALMTFCSQAVSAKILNSNECRALLDYNPREGGDEFTNPAIDKSANAGGAANNPVDPAKQAGEQKAMRSMLCKLIGVECNRINAATKNSSKFFDWMDSFYATWEAKLADSIEELGGDRDLATEYCNESKRRLIEASECKPEEFSDTVSRCVEAWPNRVNTLIEGMLLCPK